MERETRSGICPPVYHHDDSLRELHQNETRIHIDALDAVEICVEICYVTEGYLGLVRVRRVQGQGEGKNVRSGRSRLSGVGLHTS